VNISTFAQRAGISASGVRWYEAAGILPAPARAENGYRQYSDSDLARLTMIAGGGGDPALTATLERQHRRIAQQREELERLELELVDLERTMHVADPARRRPPVAPIGVLFVCNGNSARSQIAEALLGHYGGADFEPRSAGTQPKSVHPLAVQVLAEIGIDWRGARAKSVMELVDRRFDYVVTLSNSAREACPTLPGPHGALHWHLEDPAAVEGPTEARLEAFRATRTELSVRLRPFIEIARRAAGRLPAITGPEPEGDH
jgi:arsenate reductase